MLEKGPEYGHFGYPLLGARREFRIFLNFHIFDIQGGGGGSPDPILENYLFPSFSRNDSGIRPEKQRKQTGKKAETFSGKRAESFKF